MWLCVCGTVYVWGACGLWFWMVAILVCVWGLATGCRFRICLFGLVFVFECCLLLLMIVLDDCLFGLLLDVVVVL